MSLTEQRELFEEFWAQERKSSPRPRFDAKEPCFRAWRAALMSNPVAARDEVANGLMLALTELMAVAEESLDMRPEFRRAISKAHSAIWAREPEQKVSDCREIQIGEALGIVQQDYSRACQQVASAREYVVDAVTQLIDAGYVRRSLHCNVEIERDEDESGNVNAPSLNDSIG